MLLSTYVTCNIVTMQHKCRCVVKVQWDIVYMLAPTAICLVVMAAGVVEDALLITLTGPTPAEGLPTATLTGLS